MAMVWARRMLSTCGRYIFRWFGSNIYKRTDVSIYDAAVSNYHFSLNTRSNSNYSPRDEDMAIWAVIENQIGIRKLNGLFLIAVTLMQISQSQTAYLRAHKREPIAVTSVTDSLLTGILVWLTGSRFGPIGAVISYIAVMPLVVIWETYIWLQCPTIWHKLTNGV